MIREWNRIGFLKLNCRCGGAGVITTTYKNTNTGEKARCSEIEHDDCNVPDHTTFWPSESAFWALNQLKYPDYEPRYGK